MLLNLLNAKAVYILKMSAEGIDAMISQCPYLISTLVCRRSNVCGSIMSVSPDRF
jgi:hypothetical protein